MKLFFLTIQICIIFLSVPLAAAAEKKQPVFVAMVGEKQVTDRVEALGTLRANESVELTATVTETITAIHFDDGERVPSGKILVEMTSREEHAQLEEAAALAREAKMQYERLLPLAKDGGVSAALLDEREREAQTARARLEAIRSRLADRLITAPFSGVVGLRFVSVGALIEPGDLITTLDDDRVMKLDFTVPSLFLESLRPGLSIEATAAALPSAPPFEGTIRSIDSRIDPLTRAIRVRALLPNPEHLLRPGMLMRVELLRNPRNALVIPEEALVPTGETNHVLVVDRSTAPPVARQREVATGTRLEGWVEITEGLAKGEEVITHGTLRVRPGQAVEVSAVDSGDQSLPELLQQQRPGAQP